MSLKNNGFWTTASLVVLATGIAAQSAPPQAPTPQKSAPPAQADRANQPFRIAIDLVSNDIIVRDERGNFVPDLKKDEFEIWEDGVKQDITSMTVVTGGKVNNLLAPPPPPPPEGIILPPTKPRNDVSGRIFLFFVDDLHMQFHNTGRIRDLFRKISKELVHDGDMFGIVSSGPSSIAVDMTYDKNRLEEAIKKIAEAIGIRLTKAKLAQVVPIAGAIVGGGFNAWFVGSVTETAYHLYRERWLIEKHGESAAVPIRG